MTILWTTVAILLFLCWVVSIVDLFKRHLGAGKTAAWLLLVVLVPFVGTILYWVLRKPSQEEMERQLASEQRYAADPGQRLRDTRRLGS
jgi:hypothetical protein